MVRGEANNALAERAEAFVRLSEASLPLGADLLPLAYFNKIILKIKIEKISFNSNISKAIIK